MIFMGLVMALPLLGLALFLVYPWQAALVPYLGLVAASVVFDVFMMRAMRLPTTTGRNEIVGSTAIVLNWAGAGGQVRWRDEIWQAESGAPLAVGDRVVIEDVRGLSLLVRPARPTGG